MLKLASPHVALTFSHVPHRLPRALDQAILLKGPSILVGVDIHKILLGQGAPTDTLTVNKGLGLGFGSGKKSCDCKGKGDMADHHFHIGNLTVEQAVD